MNLNWLQSLLLGIVSGLADILPVSGQAHRVLLLKFFGFKDMTDLARLMLHLSVFAALYLSSQGQFVRMNRARALARVPKRKRKRPLDTKSMMDWSLLKTMLVPVILGLFLYRYVQKWETNLVLIALFLLLNGLILYIPQFLPTSNRDSRTLSRVEGLLMGLGGMASILPGISTVGTMVSVGSVCGVERVYGLNMALIIKMFLVLGLAVYDVLGIFANGMEALSFVLILQYVLMALVSFGAAMLGVRIMRRLAAGNGFSLFGVYCWGMALFLFILNLVV
ncbi:MAG: undecaprenyl-diphosphate phosphatase [Candidatus Faecousia sp.]|nr:undecaprenyl-diphosphate phosphatase [Candidatus Faecousia sp.]